MEVEGRKTAFVLKGSGAPVVVFIAGLGDGMKSWVPILDRLAAGRFVVADDCAHDIHKDNPDLVAMEILTVIDVVAAARTA